MSRTLVFDVNETLLDLSVLASDFEAVFGEENVLYDWFHEVIQYALALTLSHTYRPFGEVALGALRMMAEIKGVELSEQDAGRIAGKIRTLPPHREVLEALAILKESRFRLVTLTNNPQALVDVQIANAGLQHLFEQNFSVESVQRFKPAPEPYQMVAAALSVQPQQLWMIAAHAWDVGGAAQVGYRTAFVARPGKAPYPLFPKPNIIGRTLLDVAEQIVSIESAFA